MKICAAYVRNNIWKMLKIGSNVVAKAANFVIQIMPVALVLVLAKVGLTMHAQMTVKHLSANTAIEGLL